MGAHLLRNGEKVAQEQCDDLLSSKCKFRTFVFFSDSIGIMNKICRMILCNSLLYCPTMGRKAGSIKEPICGKSA